MVTINGLTNSAGAATTVELAKLETAQDLNQLATMVGIPDTILFDILRGAELGSGTISLEELIDKAVEKVPGNNDDADKIIEKLNKLRAEIKKIDDAGGVAGLKKRLNELNAKNDKDLSLAEKKEKAEINNQLKLYNAMGDEVKDITENILKKALDSKDISPDKKEEIKQLINKQDPGKGANTGDKTTPPANPGYKGLSPNNSGIPDAGGAGGAGYKGFGDGGLNPDNPFNPQNPNYIGMTGASMVDDMTMGLWDMVGEQKKRQQMMMMFFYFARMAMSGDIGAMYQFMRFIGTIICKDKAMQNVWMGTKLLQLQEYSRSMTEKLLKMDVTDDTESSIAWQKELQKIKSEEGIVATSQKLITQMMEEFTQINEQMMNMTKSLLDVNGKITSNLSVWR